MKFLAAWILILTGCASTSIPFQRLNNGVGYTVEEKSSDHLIVKTNLPNEISSSAMTRYIARAVGEECLQRGFEYFDFTEHSNGTSEGFCFKENKRKGFGITFTNEGRNANPAYFEVEDLNQKSRTTLKIGDRLIEADQQQVTSIGQLKKMSFEYGKKGITEVNLKILRDGKPMTLSEPLAEVSNGAYGPKDLKTLKAIRF